jgi:energy-coupling factor transporter ATP-binding protein EcfA2
MPRRTTPPAETSGEREIELTNVAPIEHVKIKMPKAGGLVVLNGKNGSGKSRALQAVNKMVSGQGTVDLTDGAESGEVEGLGILMKIANKITRSGELEVQSLEGRFSVLDLVEPKITEALAADAKRIKALIQLTGTKADASLFYKLLGGKKQFGEMISAAAVETQDIVVMASRIKRDIEAKARTAEDTAEKNRASAKAHKEAAGEVDINRPADREELSRGLESAVREEEKLKTEAQNALDADQRATMARRALKEAEANYKGPTSAEAEKAVAHAQERVTEQHNLVNHLEEELRQAKEELRSRIEWGTAQEKARITAVEHEASMQASRDAIAAASNVTDVDEAQLQAAAEAVRVAREAVEQGAIIRRAKESLARAEEFVSWAKAAEKEAIRLRDAAAGIDGVLSGVVQKLGCPLRVHQGRLVTDTDRGEELFSDLSRGEQWKLALDIAIDAVGENGILVIDQSGFEGLDDFNRATIHKHLQGTGVVMLTAEKTNDEEVVARTYEPTSPAAA